MLLLNPKKLKRPYPDEKSAEIMRKTVEFFENKGLTKIKEHDRTQAWYADFLEFIEKEKIFSTLLTPPEFAVDNADARWDTWRNCEFNEILGFYGLCYWYTWQVSILGLGPIWMSPHDAPRERAAKLLDEGAIFAFGLSEREHGADIYSTEMRLVDKGEGKYLANGEKYYIGNGNEAEMVSTFGKMEGTDEYVFFAANYHKNEYDCVRNVCTSQNYVAQYALKDYPVGEDDILSRGKDAWNSALNTVNVGKYNLGWASIGIATHAFYEAINHAASRRLYNMYVTDFPHVKQMFTDAYVRLVAMKLFALRAADYMRVASPEDRRYLLYNPIVKMKVTRQGEEVIDLIWDVIAAKGFEKDTFFEMAARDIRALPKLEGTVHVNIALVVKFMPNYFFFPGEYEEVSTQDEARHDAFLFDQGASRGLGKIQFHDYAAAFASWKLPNVELFASQVATFKEMLAAATPDDDQRKDVDFLLGLGEIFTLVVYAQLVLENARIYDVDDDVIDQMFDCFVRDVSKFALDLHGKPSTTELQADYCRKLIERPKANPERYERVWKGHVHALKDLYRMSK